ncbi:unnamed protein product [Lepeophtheirus salmonis]|uniref:(salmon louse) hypothetical protein n=1 Tax=Lepeophtheirus salmonis TaxID=72036 RepID=A0A7R8HD32_LEPSM|nr:unnamed protein product [Lepeophtheirus salmonis]CAF3022505.1 unnamed protein product [Lepeophtheirus salmonis]
MRTLIKIFSLALWTHFSKGSEYSARLTTKDLALISSASSTSITLNEDPSRKCVLEYRCPDCKATDLSFVPQFDNACDDHHLKDCQLQFRIVPFQRRLRACRREKQRVCNEVCHGCPEFCDYNKLYWCEDEYKIQTKVTESQVCEEGNSCESKIRQRVKTDELSSKRACYEKVIGKVCAPLNCKFVDMEEDCYYSNSTIEIKLTRQICNVCEPSLIKSRTKVSTICSSNRLANSLNQCLNEGKWVKRCFNQLNPQARTSIELVQKSSEPVYDLLARDDFLIVNSRRTGPQNSRAFVTVTPQSLINEDKIQEILQNERTLLDEFEDDRRTRTQNEVPIKIDITLEMKKSSSRSNGLQPDNQSYDYNNNDHSHNNNDHHHNNNDHHHYNNDHCTQQQRPLPQQQQPPWLQNKAESYIRSHQSSTPTPITSTTTTTTSPIDPDRSSRDLHHNALTQIQLCLRDHSFCNTNNIMGTTDKSSSEDLVTTETSRSSKLTPGDVARSCVRNGSCGNIFNTQTSTNAIISIHPRPPVVKKLTVEEKIQRCFISRHLLIETTTTPNSFRK